MSQIEVGSKVEAVSATYGWGSVEKGDIGVVVCKQHDGDFVVDFPNQHAWCARPYDLKLVEDKPVFKAMKFRVHNSGHSTTIQKCLMELGYRWRTGDGQVQNTTEKFLYTNQLGYITYGESEQHFQRKEYPEFKADSFVAYKLVEVPVTPETVELNGKTYLKADLEAALAKLTPMQKPVSVK